MRKFLSKKKILYIMLIIGVLPFVITFVCGIYSMSAGADFLWQRYYGVEALEAVFLSVGLVCMFFWYIAIPWVVFLIVIPIISLVKNKLRGKETKTEKVVVLYDDQSGKLC